MHIAALLSAVLIPAQTILQLTAIENIARGTADQGYWVCNLNQISDESQFENIIQVTDSIPWVRCASGNVFIIFHMIQLMNDGDESFNLELIMMMMMTVLTVLHYLLDISITSLAIYHNILPS